MAEGKTTRAGFYGAANIPRPYLVMGEEGKPVENRVDPPKAHDALLGEWSAGRHLALAISGRPLHTRPRPSPRADWAGKAPFSAGGALLKPEWDEKDGPAVPQPRTDFAIFMAERHDDIVAANPALMARPDRKALMAAAAVYWRDTLTADDRRAYREKSKGAPPAACRDATRSAAPCLRASPPERGTCTSHLPAGEKQRLEEEQASNPEFAAYRDKLQARPPACRPPPPGRMHTRMHARAHTDTAHAPPHALCSPAQPSPADRTAVWYVSAEVQDRGARHGARRAAGDGAAVEAAARAQQQAPQAQRRGGRRRRAAGWG